MNFREEMLGEIFASLTEISKYFRFRLCPLGYAAPVKEMFKIWKSAKKPGNMAPMAIKLYLYSCTLTIEFIPERVSTDLFLAIAQTLESYRLIEVNWK